MARDVEFNVTADDKTGTALAAAERHFEESQKRIDKINKDHSDRRRKDLDDSAAKIGRGLEQVFGKTAPKLSQSLAGAFATASEAAGPLLAVGIAAAAPLVGATISAAVIGGAGVGGVIGGVALAAKDPRVQAAGKSLGTNLMGELQRDAAVFVAPVLRNIDKIEDRFDQLNPHIEGIFRNSSSFLDPLVDGALDGIDGILGGVEALTAKGKPVMDQLGRSLGKIGGAVGDALETIAGGSDDAAKALEDVTDQAVILIRTTGYVVRGLTEVYGALDKIGVVGKTFFGPVVGPLVDLISKVKGVGKAAEDAKPPLDAVAGSTTAAGSAAAGANAVYEDMAPNLDRIAEATQDVYDRQNDLYRSTTSVAEAVARATGTIKENGRTLDINSDKGRRNRDALSDVASALQRQYDNYVKVNGVGPRSAAVADDLRGKFQRLAEKAGLGGDKARDLANRLLNIPSSRETKVKVQTEAAMEKAREIKRALDSVKSKTVTVRVSVTGTERLDNLGHRIGGYSAGDASWAPAGGPGEGMARTGGPTPVRVTNNFDVFVNGVVSREEVVRIVEASERRSASRARVGRR